MVTIIENEAAVCENPYPGMNLAEACMQLQLEASEIVNDLNMSVLLDEHAYLLENGVELDYLTEGEKFNTIKEKVKNAIKAFGQKIGELWDKLIEWFINRKDEVIEWFAQHTIDKKHKDLVAGKLGEIEVKCKLNGKVDPAFLEKDNYSKYIAMGFNINREYFTKDDVYKNYYTAEEEEIVIDKDKFNNAMDIIFNNTFIKDIKAKKAEALDNLKRYERQINEARPDNTADLIESINVRIRANTDITNEFIKLYHFYVNQCIKIVRCAFANKDIKAAVDAARGDERKQAAKDFKENLKAAPGKTVETLKAAPGKTKEAGKNFFNSVVEKTRNLKNK